MKTRIEREKVTIRHMIRLYCRHHHSQKGKLCSDCNELLEYALARVEHCVFGINKPVCSECKVHCYKNDMREKVRQVMRYTGPRMLFRHPVLAIMHLVDKRKLPGTPSQMNIL
jgi:predicted amidophosphoribosyltransferase